MRNEKGQFVKGSNEWIGRKHKSETIDKLKVIHLSGRCSCHKNNIGYWSKKKRPKEELSAAWKGVNVGYVALHEWIYRKLGKPNKCKNCGKEESNNRKIHWANISHKYKRELKDWIRLCAKCHKNYDLNKIKLCV